jgi:hypothetical protein
MAVVAVTHVLLLQPKGNPVKSMENIPHIHRIKDDVVSAHKVNGNVQLLPGEIRNLRDYLVGSGTICNLQVYVMILLGIKLFLRVNELLDIQVDDFVKDNYKIPDRQVIRSLALTFKVSFSLCNFMVL